MSTTMLELESTLTDRYQTTASEMIHGIHLAFLVLGGVTVLSTIVFYELKSDDGEITSQHVSKNQHLK